MVTGGWPHRPATTTRPRPSTVTPAGVKLSPAPGTGPTVIPDDPNAGSAEPSARRRATNGRPPPPEPLGSSVPVRTRRPAASNAAPSAVSAPAVGSNSSLPSPPKLASGAPVASSMAMLMAGQLPPGPPLVDTSAIRPDTGSRTIWRAPSRVNSEESRPTSPNPPVPYDG